VSRAVAPLFLVDTPLVSSSAPAPYPDLSSYHLCALIHPALIHIVNAHCCALDPEVNPPSRPRTPTPPCGHPPTAVPCTVYRLVKWIRLDCLLRSMRADLLIDSSHQIIAAHSAHISPSPSLCSELWRCGASRSTRNMGPGVPSHSTSDPTRIRHTQVR
jgi:hypothetical protein